MTGTPGRHTLNGGATEQFSSSDLRFFQSKRNHCGWSELRYIGHRHSSDPKLLWLWQRPVATAPIQPLAWEPPYAAGAAERNSKKDKIIIIIISDINEVNEHLET